MTTRTTVLIAILADKHDLLAQYERWHKLRQSNTSGHAAIQDGALLQRGNGLFWQESDKLPGMVFLFRPERVLTALEEFGND